MKEYQSREYCRDIFCETQLDIDSQKKSKTIAKRKCKRCDAYKFHQWLKDNGYKIVKGEGNDRDN